MAVTLNRGGRRVIGTVLVCLALLALFTLRTLFTPSQSQQQPPPSGPKQQSPPPPPSDPHLPRYKPTPSPKPPVVEHFPRAASAKSPSDLPPVPSWNTPPSPHVNETTPLFIGFTRNWELLQQCLVSYINAGWPVEDIYVVENTGTMFANQLGQLTLQNPFYLDYRRLKEVFGVNVLTTPTLYTFAQLQNFYLYTAITKGWDHYFWSHMDVAVLSNEQWRDPETDEYKSLYMRAVDDIRETRRTRHEPDAKGRTGGWAIRFYRYDMLALVNRTAFESVGGWDTMIPFYGTDCDMHSRLFMSGFKQGDAAVGRIYDIGRSVDDLEVYYRRAPIDPQRPDDIPPQDAFGGAGFEKLSQELADLSNGKLSGDRLRWQGAQTGGQGEPYYRDARGFQQGLDIWAERGKNLMAEKWGRRGCDLKGLKPADAWLVEHDWE